MITFKDVETENQLFKARFVAHGNRDKEKEILVHDTTTVCHSSIRMLAAVAVNMGFDICTEDVSQAYLQSASELMRDIYIRPNKQLHMPAGHVLKLLQPLKLSKVTRHYFSNAYVDNCLA